MFLRFLFHLLAIITVTIFVTGVISYQQLTKSAERTAEQYLINELEGLYKKYDSATVGVKTLSAINNDSMVSRAKSAAKIIELTPGILKDKEALLALCNSISADSILICNGDGIIEVSTPEDMEGQPVMFDKREVLLRCAAGKAYPGTFLGAALDNSNRQVRYAYVRRTDAPGLIIMAFYLEYEHMARELSNIADLVSNASIGDNGFLIAFDRGEPFSIVDLPTTEAELRALQLNNLLELEFDGKEYFVYCMLRNGVRLIAMVPTEEYFGSRSRSVKLRIFSAVVLIVAVVFAVFVLMRRYITTPITQLNDKLWHIGSGHFDERVHIQSSEEFRQLSQSINIMLDSMRSTEDLATEHNQRELTLARSIKDSVLPNVAQIYGDRKDFSMAVSLVQAETVGGDFYDCLLVDDDHLVFVIASIAEQGIPAALYMMRGLAIIRNYISITTDPSELATHVNIHICRGDSTNIRVAMLVGCLEISTGTLSCVNAGLHTPLLQREGQPYTELPVPVSPVFGRSIDSVYKMYTFTMQPGDRFFACTSALTCMKNEKKELFGEQRLHAALHEAAPTVRDVPHLIRTAVRRFIGRTERDMDYTMLCLERPGGLRSGGSTVVTAGESAEALEMIEQALQRVFAAPNDITDIIKVTSTIMAAIPAETQVRVVLGCTENHAKVTLTYAGEEKNILENLTHLPKDAVSYHHAQNINDITFHNVLG